MRGLPHGLIGVVFAWLVEMVIGLAWLGALVVVGFMVATFLQMRAFSRALKANDRRVADLEAAIGTGSGD